MEIEMRTLFRREPLEIKIEENSFSETNSLGYEGAKTVGDVQTKIARWGPQHAGHCTLDAPMLEIRSNGWFTFSGNLSSSSDDDSWGILHIDLKQDNGYVLWSSGAFWSPTIGDWAPWIVDSTYPAYLFDTIAKAAFSSHC
jgi:hypothetical protein